MELHTGRGGITPSINVTPMIDILLVLLIVFMAIAPVRSVGLDASLPQNSNGASLQPETPVVLEIAPNGKFFVNSVAVQASLLRDRLVDIYRRRADRVLYVKADRNLEFRVVAEAIDTARSANLSRIGLLTN